MMKDPEAALPAAPGSLCVAIAETGPECVLERCVVKPC